MRMAVLLAGVLLTGAAQANCQLYGTCDERRPTYGQDRVWTGTTDYYGNEIWTDNRGNRVEGWTDYFGNRHYRDNRGGTVECTKDYFGNVTCSERSPRYGSLFD